MSDEKAMVEIHPEGERPAVGIQHHNGGGEHTFSGWAQGERVSQADQATVEPLTQAARWRLILSAACQAFLRGKVLGSTGRLAQATG